MKRAALFAVVFASGLVIGGCSSGASSSAARDLVPTGPSGSSAASAPAPAPSSSGSTGTLPSSAGATVSTPTAPEEPEPTAPEIPLTANALAPDANVVATANSDQCEYWDLFGWWNGLDSKGTTLGCESELYLLSSSRGGDLVMYKPQFYNGEWRGFRVDSYTVCTTYGKLGWVAPHCAARQVPNCPEWKDFEYWAANHEGGQPHGCGSGRYLMTRASGTLVMYVPNSARGSSVWGYSVDSWSPCRYYGDWLWVKPYC